MKKLVWISVSLFAAACGDNLNSAADAGPGDTSPAIDAAIDAPVATFVTPTPVAPMISAMGPDQVHAIKPGPNGSFYLAGFAAQTATGPKTIFVAKMTATGPDPTFGTIPNTGIALIATAVTPTGGSDEIDLAVQSDGKILVSFNLAHGADDRDVGVARITTAGALDLGFGGANTGIAVIDFSTRGTTSILDTARGLAVDASDNVFVHAVALAPGGGRTDSDFALAKLTPNGVLATGWGAGDAGKFFLDTPVNGVSYNATARGVIALPDGSVIAGGYTNALPPGNQPVIYKLDANGDLATGFASGGVFFDMVLGRQTEVYNFALQNGTHVVTGGYGNVAGVDRDDWVSLRFDVTTGARDLTGGGAPNGAKLIDVSASGASSNCRNAVALPGGKTLLIGSSGRGQHRGPGRDVRQADASGNLDPAYGPGIHRIKDSRPATTGTTSSGARRSTATA